LEPEFPAKAVEGKWRPVMERVVDEVLDKMLSKAKSNQPIDLVEEFATPVPTQITYQALGIPASDVDRLSTDSEIRNSTSRNAAETANTRLEQYISELIQARMSHANNAAEEGDDIIARLIAEHKRDGFSFEVISALAFLVLTAGNAALISSIAVGVLILLDHPDQRDIFLRDPVSLAGKLVTLNYLAITPSPH
jgi:nitric oxide reductase